MHNKEVGMSFGILLPALQKNNKTLIYKLKVNILINVFKYI